MIEGWSGDEYYTLFDQADYESLTREYGVDGLLPGFVVTGLIGWDDFLLFQDSIYFSCPTVPIVPQYVRRLALTQLPTHLHPDKNLTGRCKWYVTPLVFGGKPTDDSNLLWVNYTQHRELVRWWNEKYAEMRS
jgi:hypothetical protein